MCKPKPLNGLMGGLSVGENPTPGQSGDPHENKQVTITLAHSRSLSQSHPFMPLPDSAPALLKTLLLSLALPLFCTGAAFAMPPAPKQTDFKPESYKQQEKYKTVQMMTVGHGADRAYAFFPADASPQQLPLVIFLHGWMGTNPKNFGAMIDHLVRRGSVVIYPVYQVDGNTVPQGITDTAAASIAQALGQLNAEQPGLVDLQKTMYYGFSMGASMSINFVANPDKYKLPAAKSMVLSAPGDAKHVAHGPLSASIVTTSIAKVPLSTPIVLLSGQDDKTIGMPTAVAYWNQICAQRGQRTLITWPSGKTAQESISSAHGAPGAPDERYDFPSITEPVPLTSIEQLADFPDSKSINNLDFHGQWKVVTGLLDALQSGNSPDWIFTDKRLMADLGHFKNAEPYPSASIEQACPASFVEPSTRAKSQATGRARPKQK